MEREASLGNVAAESAREMIVMLKFLVARRAARISVPIVPLAFEVVSW
jgi:hypothetical protein